MPFKDPTQQAEGKASRWVNEPLDERHPSLKVHTKRPINAEPSNLALQEMYTPRGQHYRRTHAPVPLVDNKTFSLPILIQDDSEKEKLLRKFSLNELKNKFAEKEISVTLMCTGNRRSEFNPYGSTAGLPWKNGSISTAKWRGCLLRDILNDAGLFYDRLLAKGYKYVTFWGLEGYHISIPLDKAMHVDGDCIIANAMNGEPLPRDHGAPVRLIVPGFVGSRSVKWLQRIVLMKRQVVGMHQTGIAYKQFGPNLNDFGQLNKQLIDACPPIDIIPVTSAVTAPEPGSTCGDVVEVKGYAYSGGGRAVVRVDVSVDGGDTWTQAKLTRADGQGVRSSKAWAWSQWTCTAKVKSGAGEVSICAKAIDDQYNQQPHTAAPIWNIRGVLNTSWGRVKVLKSKL